MSGFSSDLRGSLEGDRRAWSRARTALLESWEADPTGFDDRLDEVAAAAAGGSAPATELLLTVIHELGLARPAILRLVVDPVQVDEAAQTTLVAVERSIRTFEARSRFRTWLFTIARNEALGLIRKSSRRASDVPYDEAPSQVTASGAARLSSVVASRATVEEAMEVLPSPYRETLELRVRSQLGYPEIAEHLGVPVGTVKSRIAKARELLLTELGGVVQPGTP